MKNFALGVTKTTRVYRLQVPSVSLGEACGLHYPNTVMLMFFATNLDELPIPWIGNYIRKWMLRVGIARLFDLDLYFVLKVAENSKPNATE